MIISETLRPQSCAVMASSVTSGRGGELGTFSCVSANEAVVNIQLEHKNRNARNVLNFSFGNQCSSLCGAGIGIFTIPLLALLS